MSAYTVCFCGTACSRDEGEQSRAESDRRIYCADTGYIPVRIHRDISGNLGVDTPSVTVRGVGENDWADPRSTSERLVLNAPLKAPQKLLEATRRYAGGDRRSKTSQLGGWEAAALALHGANKAAASGADAYNLIGHSRGAVETVMAAWFLYAYGPRDVPVRIFAIDPVPGPGDWYGIITQLPPNVAAYVGVYAWDHLDDVALPIGQFTPVVPRPNARMIGRDAPVTLGDNWKKLADSSQLDDPLAGDPGARQPGFYDLYVCRGRHGTVAGNTTRDGLYDASRASESAGRVPQLVYKMARAHLAAWGTKFAADSPVAQRALELRRLIHSDHADFDAMAGGAFRNSKKPARPYVRRVSSTRGRAPWETSYLEDVVGDPPYRLSYPVTSARTGRGWAQWKFL